MFKNWFHIRIQVSVVIKFHVIHPKLQETVLIIDNYSTQLSVIVYGSTLITFNCSSSCRTEHSPNSSKNFHAKQFTNKRVSFTIMAGSKFTQVKIELDTSSVC